MSYFDESIIILGCHRSGTSALSAVLSSCGFDLPGGHVDTGKHENPEGYYENKIVVHANNRVLKALGYRWDDPVELDRQIDGKLIAYFRQDVSHIVQTHFSRGGYVLKDPRMSTLWPLWLGALQSVGGGAVKLLVAVRHPTRVAESLIRRHEREPRGCNIATLDDGYRFWIAQTSSALRAALFEEFMIVDSDAFVKNPLDLMLGMRDRLCLGITDKDIRRGVDTFEREIRRNDLYMAASEDEGTSSCSEPEAFAKALYRRLLDIRTHDDLWGVVCEESDRSYRLGQ